MTANAYIRKPTPECSIGHEWQTYRQLKIDISLYIYISTHVWRLVVHELGKTLMLQAVKFFMVKFINIVNPAFVRYLSVTVNLHQNVFPTSTTLHNPFSPLEEKKVKVKKRKAVVIWQEAEYTSGGNVTLNSYQT